MKDWFNIYLVSGILGSFVTVPEFIFTFDLSNNEIILSILVEYFYKKQKNKNYNK